MVSLGVAIGPALFALGLAVTYFVPELGPLDRAKVQGFVGLPLMAVGPAVAGLAGRPSGVPSLARRSILVTAAVIGMLATWLTAVSLSTIRCRPITEPIDALPEAAVIGFLAAVTYGAAGIAALRAAARRPHWAALAIGAATFIGLAALTILVVFVALFPPVSCAPAI